MTGSLRVLILEDRPADAELMIDALRQGGFDPDWCRVETQEAYLAHLTPDLDVILADYTLPQFDAPEALRLLRERSLDIPFIVVTGTIGEEAAVACLRQGAYDYLIKDRLARLSPAVEQALVAKRLRDERRAAEREARVSARQWRATFDAISNPVFLLDAGGRIARSNEAAGEFAGERLADLIGRPCWEVVHGTTEPVDGSPYRRALRTQRREAQVWQRDHCWFETVVDPMLDDEGYLVGFVYILEEITEQKRTEQALRQRNRELSLLNRAARTLNASLELEAVLGSVLEEVRGLLDVVGCSAWLRDPQSDELVCRQVVGPRSEVVRDWRLPPGEGVVGWVVERGESLIVPDAQRDERHFVGVDEETGLSMRSILCVPLAVQGRVIGALEAVDTEAGRFDSRDRRLLEALAAFAANAIQNARLYEQAEAEIARRETTQEALVEAKERYRLLVERNLAGVYRTTLDGEILACNDALARVFGYDSSEEILKARACDLYLDEADRDAFLRRLQDQGALNNDEVRMRRKDGSVVWVLENATLIEEDDRTIIEGTLIDFTEHKRAEVALQEERDLVRRLLENSPVCITRVSRDGTITFANVHAERVLGLSKDEITARSYRDAEWRITDYDGRPFPDEELPFRRIMETAEPVRDIRHAIQWPDGRRVLLSVSGIPLFDERGELDGAVFAIQDVTRQVSEREALIKRLKELRCLYAVYRDMHRELSLDDLCQQILAHLKPAMQFPEIAIPVIELDGDRIRRAGFRDDLSHRLEADIEAHGETRGRVQIYYAEEKPFLIPEEQDLLDAVADGLGFWLERRRAEETLQENVQQLRRTNRLFLGREERVLELKREVNALLKEQGDPPRYESPMEADVLRDD